MTRTTSRACLRRRVCLAAAAVLLAAGCGSSKQHTTATNQAGESPQAAGGQTTTTATESATTSAAHGATAAATTASRSQVAPSANRSSANGGSANGRTAGSATAPAAAPSTRSPGGSPAAPATGSRRFTYLANAVCGDAAGGAPARPVPTSAAQLRQYARAALPPAQRINLSLERLSAQTGHTAGVAHLLLAYRALLALYRQAAHGNGHTVSSRSITAAQQSAAASARALHLPLCAPVPIIH